jgi:hypothetical protein
LLQIKRTGWLTAHRVNWWLLLLVLLVLLLLLEERECCRVCLQVLREGLAAGEWA